MTQAQKLKDLASDHEGERTQSLWHHEEMGHLMVSRIPVGDGWETMIFPSDDEGNVTDWLELYSSCEYETHDQSIGHYCNQF